jgi:hypothetical protein
MKLNLNMKKLLKVIMNQAQKLKNQLKYILMIKNILIVNVYLK